MSLGVTLSLLAALAYGICHFTNGALTRRVSGIAIGALAQIGGTLVVLLVAPFYPAPQVTVVSLAWGALSGVGSASLAFLYRGMERGQISVVSPVSELSASLLPVLFGFIIGERLSLISSSGVVLSIPAILLTSGARVGRAHSTESTKTETCPQRQDSTPESTGRSDRKVIASGVTDGLLGGAGVALTWVALSQVAATAGLWPLVVSRVVSLVVMVLIARGMKVSLRVPISLISLSSVAGAVGTVATGLYMFATRLSPLAVVTVITALYPVIPVFLAVGFLREKLSLRQVIGLAMAVVAVVLLAE